jgi:hypothetical protein
LAKSHRAISMATVTYPRFTANFNLRALRGEPEILIRASGKQMNLLAADEKSGHLARPE